MLGREGGCTFANAAWARLTAQVGHAALGLGWLKAIHPADRAEVEAAVRHSFDEPGDWRTQCRTARPAGDPRWLRLQGTRLADGAESLGDQLVAAIDVTTHVRAVARLRHRLDRDAVTRLPGRTVLRDAVEAGLRLVRSHDRPLGLLILDLDAFGEINDAFGLEVGDQLLARIARRLSRAVRPGDTVVRLGGDEFAVVLPDIGHAEGAWLVAQHLQRAIDRPLALAGQRLAVSVSIGIALAPEGEADDPAQLLRQADLALQRAKRNHLGIAFFEADLSAPRPATYAHLADLRKAIRAGQLALHFQPWLRLRDGRVHAMEALVRWNHPQRGVLPPSEFIPFAEGSGLIRELDLAVLELACRQVAAWRGTPLAAIRVAINISRASLLDEQFPAALAAALIRYQLEGPELQLEITENGLFGDPKQAIWLAERLSALGVTLAIDDFGTGYSSLAQLRYLCATTLKIDRGFVTHALQEPTDAAIVETVVALGHRFGKEVVAEGVEDAATLEMLARLGVDDAQGYFISRPVPPEVLEPWLRTRLATSPSLRAGVPPGMPDVAPARLALPAGSR